MSTREKILILVKTYPTPSTKYVETVCTAGIREDGSWVRIFPVPFRSYNEYKRYKKYQWVECSVFKSDKDNRPESFHIDTVQPIRLLDDIPPKDHWVARRKAVLGKAKIYTKKSELLAASESNQASLAIFKPTSVRLLCNKAEVEVIDPVKMAKIEQQLRQVDLFEENSWRQDFKLAEQLPYDFKYEITDSDGVTFKHKIIDWELGALFWGQKRKKGIEGARQDVIYKYGTELLNSNRDLYLYMGTMFKFQKWGADNPWTIIGVAPFPKMEPCTRQGDLFGFNPDG